MSLHQYPARLLFTILSALSCHAGAEVMDFNSLLNTTTGSPVVTVGSPYIEDGFQLTTRGGVSFTYGGEAIYATTPKNANWTGTPGVYSGTNAYYGSAFRLEKVDGSVFDLLSMDAASFWSNNANAQSFSVYGYPNAGGYVYKNFTLDSTTNTLQTLTFGNEFTNLNYIIFSSVYAQVDNINLRGDSHVSTVPAPASLPLMLTGLAVVGFMAKRRKS